ncbi:MAG: cellulose-binding protein [Alteromonadaceae bacterium]|nr:MAG: cellulose-binding protein [Alteromonadaceae bacterium]
MGNTLAMNNSDVNNMVNGNRPTLKLSLLAIFLLTLLSACATDKQSTLGQLKYVAEEEISIEFEAMSHAQVREEYKDLLNSFEDEKIKSQIEHRIADVYMLEGEHVLSQKPENNNSNGSLVPKSYYIDAIKAYKNLLERYPDSPDNADVLYQLAKAYDMELQQGEAKNMLLELTHRHPSYINIAEAHFRLGDIYFGEGNYKNSAISYRTVATLSNANLHINAYYMLAWSEYKLHEFNQSAETFSHVLHHYLENPAIQKDQKIEAKSTKNQESIINDTLHSLSLALDKVGGAGQISKIEKIHNKDFSWRVYQQLGKYYFDKNLYGQAASTYRYFLEIYPLSVRAPYFHQQIIDNYLAGKFPKLALDEKRLYVESFGIFSEYHKKPGIDANTFDNLKVYLDELARFHYNLGEDATKDLVKLEKIVADKNQRKKFDDTQKAKHHHYAKAADFFGQTIATFPEGDRFDEFVFLQAEALNNSEQYQKAAVGYTHVAYTPKGDSAKAHGADAGYAAILALQVLVEMNKGNSEAFAQWQVKTVDSMLRFSEVYHSDDRSPGVLTNTAEYLFSLNQYQRAIQIGLNLINNNSNLDPTLSKTAHGIVAHSYFKVEDYGSAQKHYIAQRKFTKNSSDEYQTISERLASTTYKNSEQKLEQNDESSAIDELILIKELTPESSIRIVAQHDAASLMLKLGRWGDAITELVELNKLFPKHELAPEFPRKLAFAHRKNEDWASAAAAYLNLHRNDNDVAIQREALFSAAEMFEKNSSFNTAIIHFKAYAYAYEKPFETRMEARFKLAENYYKIKDEGKALYWLRRIIDGNAKAADQQTERSRWLASWAHVKYGDSFAKAFHKRRLRLPLPASLKKKQQDMENAIAHYQKSQSLGFFEFVTMSTYKISGLYTELSQNIEGAPKPKNLSVSASKKYRQILQLQASPLIEQAILLHLSNADHGWQGRYNSWVEKSFESLRTLQPERFNKNEQLASYGNEIR